MSRLGSSQDFYGAQQAEACRLLWIAVAGVALTHAAAAVSKSPTRESEISHQMRYFTGTGWRTICDRAGIGHKPDLVEEFLRSEHAQASPKRTYASFGFTGRGADTVAIPREGEA